MTKGEAEKVGNKIWSWNSYLLLTPMGFEDAD